MNRTILNVSALFALLVVCMVPAPSRGAGFGVLPACSQWAPYFCADAAYFLDGNTYMLEVYFRVCNEGLQFVREDDGYRASADVAIVVKDDKNRQVTGDTYRIRLKAAKYPETTSVDSCEARSVSFRARPGDFEMIVTVRDGDSGRKGKVAAAIKIPSLDRRPTLSDVCLLYRDDASQGVRWEGFRPNVIRRYGASTGGIAFYYEVYHGEGEDTVTVVQEVFEVGGASAYRRSSVVVGEGTTVHIGDLSLDSLSNGRHVLTVSITGGDGKPVVSRSKEFEVRTTSFYFGKDAEEAAEILTYIASSSMIDQFLEAGVDERKRIWEQFWREKDPTPGTPKNEFYDEHMRRFRYANEHFFTSLTEGWRTDRGNIYIMYGQPDEITEYPMEIGRNPTEVWHYISKGRRFVFVDETGFGDYVLVPGL
ncbi:MAG: GWxTD domain-containing protein [Candidatus Eisenbacteria bacterium]